MSLRKSALIAAVIILGCSLITLFVALKRSGLQAGILPKAGNPRDKALLGKVPQGFALLSLDAAYPDRAIGEALSNAGINDYISESTSWVFLDDFGELKRVPLDAYGEAVESFDPRNDGYAERLSSFFVENGRRRFFIGGNGLSYEQLEGRIAAALGEGVVFTLDAIMTARPVSRFWTLALFLAASAGVLFLALSGFGAAPRRFFPLAALLLPVQGALAFSGPGGFACSAALFGCFQCLLPPFRENYTVFYPPQWRRFRFDRVFKINWLMASLFFLAYIGIAVLTPVDPLLSVLAGLSSFAVFGLFLWVESKLERGLVHRRFVPVPIREQSFSFKLLPRITLPFAAASFLALFLPLFGPSGKTVPFAGVPTGGLAVSPAANLVPPSKEEYEAHFAYQSSFSLRPLDASASTEDDAYRSYYLGGDGLIAGTRDRTDPAAPEYPQLPPFPLEELSVFLERGGNYTAPGSRGGDIFAVAIILFLAVPSCFGSVRERRKPGDFLIFNNKGDKQAAA